MEIIGNSQIIYKALDISKYNISKVGEEEKNLSMKEITFKIIVIGDIAVGKSSIIQSLMKKNEGFKENYQATIGFDIFKYKNKVNDIIINLNIWDTCGLIDFSASTHSLFREATLAIVVYEIDKKESYQNIENWINHLKNKAKPDIIIFIVGNKNDLEKLREIKKEEAIEYVKNNNFNLFIETSAKNNEYVKELFDQAFVQLYEYSKIHQLKEDEDMEEKEDFGKKRKITLTKKQTKKIKNKKFC